jgi:hypothetical protein
VRHPGLLDRDNSGRPRAHRRCGERGFLPLYLNELDREPDDVEAEPKVAVLGHDLPRSKFDRLVLDDDDDFGLAPGSGNLC